MTEKEGNKLIVEFMGFIWEEKYNGYYKPNPNWHIHSKGKSWIEKINGEQKLKYHSSWDWLMPVVEKIHLLREVKDVSISVGRTRIWLTGVGFIQSPHKPENTSIAECWLVVVEFIKWYNQNK